MHTYKNIRRKYIRISITTLDYEIGVTFNFLYFSETSKISVTYITFIIRK